MMEDDLACNSKPIGSERAEESPATSVFETELAVLINRHAVRLTSDQIITTLERALDEALVIAGEPEATKIQRELLEAARAAEFLLAALCVDRDTETRVMLRAAISKATGHPLGELVSGGGS